MSLSNPINIATASVESIYERLCWLYASFRSTFVHNANGQSYPLSDITQLSRAKIPLPERFDEMIDYQQNEVVHDLKMEDVLCTCDDWVSRGRLEDTMRDDRDSEGKLLYITMEGVAYRDPETAANQLLHSLHHLKKFPVYLLGPANDMIGTIIMNAFETVAPPNRAPLSWIHDLQRTEVVLQNELSVNRLDVAQRPVKLMKCPLTDFDTFAAFRKSTAIAYSLWERAYEAQYDQQTSEWVTQLVEYQFDSTKILEAGPLRDKLFKVISWAKARSISGTRLSPMEVMSPIKKIFVEIGDFKLKAPAQHQLVRVGLDGPMHTKLINRQFGLVRSLNPVPYNEEALPMSYNAWDFYRRPNL